MYSLATGKEGAMSDPSNVQYDPPDGDFSVRVSEAVIQTRGPSVCAINGHVGGKSYQWGTGTLFRIAERTFLITAAHVILTAANKQANLSIADHVLGDKSPSVPLHGMAAWFIKEEF